MKNLLVYYNPEKRFTLVKPTDYEELTKIQVDNSFDLGWSKEDMVLVMNFPYEYAGVKACVVGDGRYDVQDGNRSSKFPMICRMFNDGIIEDDLYWFHDHDAFQLEPFGELDLEGVDFAYTDHGWTSMMNAGSLFFRKGARDIFERATEIMYERGLNEQTAFMETLEENPEMEKRCRKINITYNFTIYYHVKTYPKAHKPLKVAHFQPQKPRHLALYTPLVPEKFLKILNNHGLK